MKPKTKKLLRLSGCAMALGLVLAAAAYFGGAKISGVTFGPDGAHVADGTLQTLTKEFPERFQSIDLDIESGDVEFVFSDHFGAEIESCYGERFSCSVTDGTLQITDTSASNGTVWMNFNFDFSTWKQNTVKILLPENVSLKTVKMRIGDGNADLSGFSSESTDIQDRYGNLRISDASCGAASFKLNSGSGTFQKVQANTLTYQNDYGKSVFENISVSDPQKAVISAGSGGISVKGFTASSLNLTDSYGEIDLNGLTLSNLTCSAGDGGTKITDSSVGSSNLESAYGNIDVSGLDSEGLTVNGKDGNITLAGALKGKTDVHSDYGSIGIKTTLKQEQYTFGLSTEYGSVTVDGKKLNGALTQTGTAKNELNVFGKDGNVSVEFGK